MLLTSFAVSIVAAGWSRGQLGTWGKCSHRGKIMIRPHTRALFATLAAGGREQLSTRFCRSGGRVPTDHPPMVYHEAYSCPWPEKHRFPMAKFRELAAYAVRQKVVEAEADFFEPVDPPDEWFLKVHDETYFKDFVENRLDPKAMRRIGLPHSKGLVRRTKLEVSGTILAASLALEHGLACNLAGGTHHAHHDYGSGYTVFNDLAVTARMMQCMGGVRKVVILDADVHQGDGTATLFQGDDAVYTVSFHGEDNFPFVKQASDLDIGFATGTGDDAFMEVFTSAVTRVLEEQRPDLVLYDAGVDMWEGDHLGKMKLTERCLFERDAFAIQSCVDRGIPVASVIGGGYDTDIQALARRHAIVLRAATHVWRSSAAALPHRDSLSAG